MSSKVTEVFENFADAITEGQLKPQAKFIAQMLFGITVGGSVLLSNVGRALDEPIKLIHTGRRLSMALGNDRLDDELLHDKYLEHVSQKLTKKTVIAVDMSDVAKPYALMQEGLSEIWDGSKQEVHDRGWPILGIEAIPPGRQQIPLLTHLFSRKVRNEKSDITEIRKGVFRVKDHVPQGCLWVADRGFDGRTYFKVFNDANIDWAIRLKTNRNILDRDDVKYNVAKFACRQALPFSAEFTSIQKRKKIKYTAEFGFVRVGIPDFDNRRYSLVTAWFRSARSGRRRVKPLMILTNRNIRSEGGALKVIRAYIERWGIEESFRAMKNTYGLEDLRVMTLQRLQRLARLTAMAHGFLGMVATKGRKWAVRLVERLTKNFGEAPRYLFYQLQEAVGRVMDGTGLARQWVAPGAGRGVICCKRVTGSRKFGGRFGF